MGGTIQQPKESVLYAKRCRKKTQYCLKRRSIMRIGFLRVGSECGIYCGLRSYDCIGCIETLKDETTWAYLRLPAIGSLVTALYPSRFGRSTN